MLSKIHEWVEALPRDEKKYYRNEFMKATYQLKVFQTIQFVFAFNNFLNTELAVTKQQVEIFFQLCSELEIDDDRLIWTQFLEESNRQ